MSEFPEAQAHGPVREVWDGVFHVRGSIRMGPGIRVPRNMAILRDGVALTVISAVRLSKDAEAELAKIGQVEHVVKIGHFHGLDDPYYVNRYGATYWALPGAIRDGGLEHRELEEGGDFPVADASLFRFRDTARPEGAVLVARDGGVLVTCDSVQNWVSSEGCSVMASIVMRMMGFFHPANIGPPWRKHMTPPGGTLKGDFERMLELPFSHLLSGHGAPLHDTAKADLTAAVHRVFG